MELAEGTANSSQLLYHTVPVKFIIRPDAFLSAEQEACFANKA